MGNPHESMNSSMLGLKDNDNSKAKLLSSIMDLSRIESIKQMDVGEKGESCKIFVESGNQDMLKKKRRKKITIIRKKTHRDGSIESVKQHIYKNYGNEYALHE
jgi:hypothetical protein